MKFNRTARIVGLLIVVLAFALACRTIDLVSQARPDPTRTRPRPTSVAARATRTKVVVEAQIEPPTQEPQQIPTDPPPPTSEPQQQPQPTNRPQQPPRPTVRPTDAPPAATPTPSFPFQVSESRCGPNVKTYIEGTIKENNVLKNGVLVRISQGPDGQPDPNEDFKTGNDPKNGYYIQNIDVNAPHEGTWYVWVIDPTTMQRISAIATVKTDAQRVEDSGNSSGSCQSATVNFTNQAPPPVQRTPTPSATTDPNGGPTLTPTQDTGNDS